MPTPKAYKDYVLTKLDFSGIFCRAMMGGYLLYLDGVLFGGLYGPRLLVKKTENNARFALSDAIPYEGAKLMYQIEDLEDKERLKEIVFVTTSDLRAKKI